MSNEGDYYYDDWHPLHDDDDDNNRHPTLSKMGKKRKETKSSPSGSSDPPNKGSDDHLSSLVVTGTKCRIHRNDDLATHLHDEKHLVDYFEDQRQEKKLSNYDDDDDDDDLFGTSEETLTHEDPLWIDRYDVRASLDTHELFPPSDRRGATDETNLLTTTTAVAKDDDDDDDALTFERYGALPEYVELFVAKNDADDESHDDVVDRETSPEGSKNNGGGDRNDAPFAMGSDEWGFVPAGMVVPETVRQNRVIQMTAARSVDGPQFEVLLKVKQAQNPDFAFLKPHHDLHPYYALLKRREVTTKKKRRNDDEGGDEVSREGRTVGLVDYASSSEGDDDAPKGVAGLVGMYSSSSDDNDDDERRGNKKTRTEGNDGERRGTAPRAPDGASFDKRSSSSSSLDERRATRLKRARLLKDRFVMKMSD